eukprot:TRINITY_DN67684_c8_g4_i1.p1 TRINITY_DN67684_c8_g4~~TRINITY_DN67684_c8_g4_i1.p1  ORF type:complete len:141 (+),score=12.54 TRINITY_DN67684_c8_g4_i1:57-479(+)
MSVATICPTPTGEPLGWMGMNHRYGEKRVLPPSETVIKTGAKTTLEAIQKGVRTATSRDARFYGFLPKLPEPNDFLGFKDQQGNKCLVKVTSGPQLVKDKGITREQWALLEGYDPLRISDEKWVSIQNETQIEFVLLMEE